MSIEDIRKKHEGFCRTTGKGALSCLNNYDVDRLFAELDEAHKKAMDMLHGNFTQCCSYCGWEAPPPNGWEELQGHIKVCPQHPLRQAEAALDEARGRIYPCADCGKMRTKEEGGTTFTVCDECWDKRFDKKGNK